VSDLDLDSHSGFPRVPLLFSTLSDYYSMRHHTGQHVAEFAFLSASGKHNFRGETQLADVVARDNYLVE
jgi:hypothetical protein